MKKSIKPIYLGILYSFVHFSVETACFYLLFSRMVATDYWFAYALIFDAVSFLPQSVVGYIADKFPRFPYGVLGLIIILASLFIKLNALAVIVISIGNVLSHVDGAEKTLNNCNNKITPNAIFVGGGAFGVVTGNLLGLLNVKWLILIPIVLIIISVVVVLIIQKYSIVDTENLPFTLKEVNDNIGDAFLIVLVLFVVTVRGYIGYAVPTDWNVSNFLTILLFVSMGAGKMLGGVLADKLGYKLTSFISLIASIPFLLFGNSIAVVSLVGVLLFNMTMPVTVGILYSRFPKNPGYAFGITTIGLFLGLVPQIFISINSLLIHQILVLTLSLTAYLVLVILLTKKSNLKENTNA